MLDIMLPLVFTFAGRTPKVVILPIKGCPLQCNALQQQTGLIALGQINVRTSMYGATSTSIHLDSPRYHVLQQRVSTAPLPWLAGALLWAVAS